MSMWVRGMNVQGGGGVLTGLKICQCLLNLALEHMVLPSISQWITITNPSMSFSKLQSFMLCCIKISFLCHIV